MNIAGDIKQTFKQGSIVTRIIYINLAVFLLVRIVSVFLFLFKIEQPFLDWFALPSDITVLATRPWTLVTYMFLHYDFLHILFNLLMFYWFGKIFLMYFDEKKLLGIYFLGGLLGGIFYILSYNFFPVFENVTESGVLLGASASVIAIVVACAVFSPNMTVNIILISSIFGPIKIIWIALFSVLAYFIEISVSNPGGNIAHLGGALWGLIYISQLKRGRDITQRFNNFLYHIDNLFTKKKKLRVSYRNNPQNLSDWDYNSKKNKEKEEMDVILDKIGKTGYNSLNKHEKEVLFNMGNRKGKPN